MYQKEARNLSVVTILQMNAKNPFDSMKCEKMNLRKSRSTIFNQLLLKIDSRFPPLARPHWKEENQGFLTVYGRPMDNFFTKNPLIGKLWLACPCVEVKMILFLRRCSFLKVWINTIEISQVWHDIHHWRSQKFPRSNCSIDPQLSS